VIKKLDNLIKTYDQLWILMINDISLKDNRMLTFIDCKLCAIKQVHNQFMGNLDVIMIGNFIKLLWFEIHRYLDQELMDSIF
jgi:hypothetical protein